MTPARHTNESVIHEIGTVLLSWIKGQFVVWLSATLLYLTGFGILRTPFWPLLAILCGLASVVPHLGMLISLTLVLLFSYVGSGGAITVTLMALGAWLLVQIVEIFLVAPRALARRLGLNPWIVILGGIAGALIAGPIGILLATPVLAVAAVIWRRTRGKNCPRLNPGKDTVKY